MKTITLLIILFTPWYPVDYSPSTLSKEDRSKAIDYLKSTQSALQASLKGLSEEQLNFKSTEEAWSIQECVEHITISEKLIFSFAQGSLEGKADPSKREELKMSDEDIFNLITNRSNKVKTRPEFEPNNQFGSYDGSLKTFKKLRKEHINYIKKTQDDLRNHYFEFPFGLADTYQVVIFMAGHSKRHIDQIEEIKKNKDFPS